jgi:hypothetical protein
LTYEDHYTASRGALAQSQEEGGGKETNLTSLIEEGLKVVLADAGRAPMRSQSRLPISKATGGTLPGIDLNRAADLEDRMNQL